MKFYSLASSSKANCYILAQDDNAIMVDCGLPKREVMRRLREAQIEPASIRAIFVSHHHSDHAGKAGELSAALHIPVYCTSGTYEQAPTSLLQKAEKIVVIESERAAFVGPFEIQTVSTYHTPGAVGYRISAQGRHAAIFTDVAELSGGVAQALERSHFAAIESDYSEPMLAGCLYDAELKRRIRMTHNSNERLASLLSNGFKWETLRQIVLLHLSKVANAAFVAEQVVGVAVERHGISPVAAEAEEVSGPWEV